MRWFPNSANLLCVLLTVTLSHATYAARIHKWTDENGNVVFGDAPVQGGTEKVEVYAGPSGVNMCDETCRAQAQGIEAKERVARYMDDPECKFQFFKNGDGTGKDLASAAKQECATNKAMQDIDSNYVPLQDAYTRWQDHFAGERATRDRAVDRAVYQQQQMTNRRELQDINRNLKVVKRRQDKMNNCLKGYGCY